MNDCDGYGSANISGKELAKGSAMVLANKPSTPPVKKSQQIAGPTKSEIRNRPAHFFRKRRADAMVGFSAHDSPFPRSRTLYTLVDKVGGGVGQAKPPQDIIGAICKGDEEAVNRFTAALEVGGDPADAIELYHKAQDQNFTMSEMMTILIATIHTMFKEEAVVGRAAKRPKQ